MGLNKNKLNRYLELLIVASLAVVLVYLVSITIRVASGMSKTVEPATYQVRLQILNGCAAEEPASHLTDQLSGYVDEDVEIKVVSTDNFHIAEIPKSFLISRTPDPAAAAVLARKIGLDPSGITYKPMANHPRNVSVPLVLGSDYEHIHLRPRSKEN
jgi:hypothetical protein